MMRSQAKWVIVSALSRHLAWLTVTFNSIPYAIDALLLETQPTIIYYQPIPLLFLSRCTRIMPCALLVRLWQVIMVT